MKNLVRLMVVAAMMALVAMLVVPAAAQDEGEDPGEDGGVIITSTFGSGPDTFSQIYCTDTACADMVGFMYLGFLGVDPEAAQIVPGADGGIVEDWTVSEDNLTYTFNLRDNLTWSDGEQINADDVLAHWDILTTPEAEHPDAFLLDVIESVEKVDDFTVSVTFTDPACTALNYAGSLAPIPEHVYTAFIDEVGYDGLSNLEWNLAPDVTSSTFAFGESVPGQTTSLLGFDAAPYTENGFVSPFGLIQVVSADQTVQVEQLLAGEINILSGPPVNRRSELREDESVVAYEFPGNSWDYMAMNIADPANPQPALDEDGNRIDQGLHPIFGDVMVRQALAHAVDVDSIIESAVFGEGSRMAAHIIPSSWAYDSNLEPREYDVDLALEMLAEAGWLPEDEGSDPGVDNPLVCKGCAYAEVDESFEGSAFEFELLTNSGNTRREAIGTVIQDELSRVGITVDFQTIDFNTLLDVMDSQSYDAFILGWRNGYPDDPNTVQLFGAQADIPGSGFNFTSFYNEEYFELETQALSVPGCDLEERAELYFQMQEIMLEEMPYMWLFVQNGFYSWRDSIEGVAPFPSQLWWNVDTWTVAQ
jgi:peptide/nickel transport system substrate-binding protein